MKKIKKQILSALWFFGTVCGVNAQNCEIPVAVNVDGLNDEFPEATIRVLENTLNRIAISSGINSDFNFCQFVLTAKMDQLDKSVLPGPPVKIVNNFGITLYLVDAYNHSKFAEEYFELNGVGNNEAKSVVDALRQLNANNEKIRNMLATGKKKIFVYYDNNYKNILKDARRKAALQQYDEAIAIAMAVPTCSSGGDEAMSFALGVYNKNLDRICLMLLNKARWIWGAGGDKTAASEAGEYLSMIDPQASCYSDAMSLYKEIKAQIRSDIHFEMREKYKDEVAIEKQRIETMRQIGVAYGKGQKSTYTNIMWLK